MKQSPMSGPAGSQTPAGEKNALVVTGVVDVRADPALPSRALVTLCARAAGAGVGVGADSGLAAAPGPDAAAPDSAVRTLEARITFLDAGIVRVTVDPTGAFSPYARPRSPEHLARIPAQPDDSTRYEHPSVTVTERPDAFCVAAGDVEVLLARESGLVEVRRDGVSLLREAAPLALAPEATMQRLTLGAGERFFGGGTQNGRAEHRGSVVRVVSTPMNSNQWGDGAVASPCPFFWSSAGYGVVRNTFAPGAYDFGSVGDVVAATHEDGVFDAYLLLAAPGALRGGLRGVAQVLLAAYHKLTGNPALLPDYAFYLGHLNAYNRDAWSFEPEEGAQAWCVHGSAPADGAGTVRYELGRRRGYVVPRGCLAESLNGPDEVLRASADNFGGVTPYEFSARAVVDAHAAHDMPLGWILPNDGYDTGYGHNGYQMTGGVDEDGASSPERLAAVAANVENLARFSTWAAGRGVETGLWTQSALTPSPDPEVTWQNLRDFRVEVGRAGISALKTDEEWVGPGYSFALDATRQAYHILGEEARRRPFVLTVDGWAGTQRYGAVWSGDQDGTDWEYIRMHLPTYLGQGLSGNPSVASDVDGIFGGDPLVATRDFQWKALTPLMLDMDGWGSLAKTPYTYGDPYTGVCRMYLKLKSELMPYLHTCAVAAAGVEAGNGDAHLPMVRSLLLAGCAGAGLGPEQLSYEFLLGDSLLVAPVWHATRPDSLGGDVRDAIYLPGGEKDLWFDYFSGAAYAGGQTLDGFDAPLWKLPLFVRAGAILPRYEAHNNPRPATESNPRGLDRTRRVVDFYPAPGVSGRYVLQEDDGDAFENRAVSEPGYGVVDDVSYGGSVSTVFSLSSREGQTVLRAEASQGGYPGYDPLRATTFRIRVDGRPASVRVRSGEKDLELREVSSAAELAAAGLAPGEAAWLYEEAPAVETHAPREERLLADLVGDAHGAPRVSVRFARVDVSACAQEVLLA